MSTTDTTTPTDTGTVAVDLDDAPRPGSRADRARAPRARDALRDTATEFGVCVRPVALRRTNLATGETDVVDVPCGSTRSAVCPACAAKARKVRAQQCREGWHLTAEPDLTPDRPTREHLDLVTERALVTSAVDDALNAGDVDTATACREAVQDVDEDLTASGLRGNVDPSTGARRVRSTKRRQDAPDLPRRPSTTSTLGRTFTDPRTGTTFRPSMFVTLTLPSYGRVRDDGTPVNPAAYDYVAAARDALHFGKLLDRWAQNLRRVAGYDVQYFAAVEPQRRLAPHVHYAIRGTLPRALVKELTAATYHQVWWPTVDRPVYDTTGGALLPVWDAAHPHADDPDRFGAYLDPTTGHPLPTWRQALDDLDDDPDAAPLHVARFGTQIDAKGVLAGSPEAEKCIGYLVKYLVKDLGEDLTPNDPDDPEDLDPDAVRPGARAEAKASAARRADHIARLLDVLRYEPCSPRCANWLRYGIQPDKPRAGMRPGCCRARAHRPTHLGYGGRRVLASRKWTAKDLADHRHDRRAHVLAVLGRTPDGAPTDQPDVDPGPVVWEMAKNTDPDVPTLQHRILRAVAHQVAWRTEYHRARDHPDRPDHPTTADVDQPAA